MMPPMFFDDEERVAKVKEYERSHSEYKPYMGNYLVFILSK
jgi:hypothetical protein